MNPSLIVAVGLLAVATTALAYGAFNDIRAYEIPNFISIAIVLAFFPFALLSHGPTIWTSLATSAAVLAVGIVLFARGWMGGGDIKLMAAVALWSGPSLLPAFGVVTGFAGALVAGLMLTPLRRLLPPAPATAVASVGGGSALAQPMPFGVAIAIGGGWVLAQRAAGLN